MLEGELGDGRAGAAQVSGWRVDEKILAGAIESGGLRNRRCRQKRLPGELVDLAALLKAGVVPLGTERAKVVLSGALTRAVTLKGVAVTKGARAAIEAAGGKIEA